MYTELLILIFPVVLTFLINPVGLCGLEGFTPQLDSLIGLDLKLLRVAPGDTLEVIA